MAQMEPMDVDSLGSDFDDKENSLYNSNVLPKTSNTEKGYEELDVSEFNMKLRYSITPASSPMSRSYTANYNPKGSTEQNNFDNTLIDDNGNLTRSLNSSIIKTDNILKSSKLPLQALPTDLFTSSEQNSSVRSFNTQNNVTLTVTGSENDDILSLPSTSSSMVHTPEATTPTKEIPKSDSGSPLMRGLKSMLNMFRSSQSPIPPSEEITTHDNLGYKEIQSKDESPSKQPALMSTPTAASKIKDNSSKRNSPLKDSVIFNDDLEIELQWKDDTMIVLKEEKNLKHKLSLQTGSLYADKILLPVQTDDTVNTTVEYMDVSYKSNMEDKTMTDIDTKILTANDLTGVESDSEFVDCETTYTKTESYVQESIEECSKTLPVVVDTFNLAQEISHEDSIDSINNVGNMSMTATMTSENIDKGILVMEEINNSTYISVDDANSVSEKSDMFITNDSSIPIDEASKSLPVSVCIEDHSNDIDNVTILLGSHKHNIEMPNLIETNDLSLEKGVENNIISLERKDIQNNMECLLSSNHSYIQESVEDNQLLKMTVQSCDLAQESCIEDYVEMINDFHKWLNTDTPIQENKINTTIDTGTDNNETQILNQTQTILPNSENVSNEENNLELINEPIITDLNNVSDKHLPNLTVVLKESEHINEDMTSSVGTDNFETKETVMPLGMLKDDPMDTSSNTDCNIDRSYLNYKNNLESERKVLNHINVSEDNIVASISVGNIGDTKECNTSHTTHISYIIDDVIMDDLQNVNVNNDAKLYNDLHSDSLSQNLSDTKDKHCEMNCNLNIIDDVKDCMLDPNNIIQLQKYENPEYLNACATSTTKTTLETNLHLFKDGLSCESNKNACNELEFVNYDTKNISNVILPEQYVSEELKNNLPLSNHDNFEKDSSIDPLVKDNNQDVYDSVKESNSGCLIKNENYNETVIHSIELIPPQDLNEQCFNSEIDDNRSMKLPDIVQAVKGMTDHDILKNENYLSKTLDEDQCDKNYVESKNVDQENLTSANNSPHISVTKVDLDFHSSPIVEGVEHTVDSNRNVTVSPKCIEKLYNINFDEIENPFATKTNIRMSPPPDTLTRKPIVLINENKKFADIQKTMQCRKKIQLHSKKLDIVKKSINKPACKVMINNNSNIQEYNDDENFIDAAKNVIKVNPAISSISNILPGIEKETKIINNKDILSEENLITGNPEYKNIFNLPEINDVNSNSLTKSRTSLSLKNDSLENNKEMLTDLTYVTTPQTELTNDILPVEDNVKDEGKVLCHMSNTTSLSKTIGDRDVTVLTEDEDTVEGPFLEAEDLMDDLKMTDTEIEKDMMHYRDLPLPSNHDDLDKDELFIDAEAFEFLLNQNKSNVVTDSGKESLFLKFDPLFANRTSSDGVLAALSSIQKNQSTPKKLLKTPVSSASQVELLKPPVLSEQLLISPSVSEEIESIGSKPMMVVSPAVNPIVTPRTLITPKVNRRSLSFTSPAMAVIDTLISLSGNTSLFNQDVITPPSSRNHDANIALTQLRELLAENKLHVYNLKCESNELQERLILLESQVKSLEAENDGRLNKIKNLNETLVEKTNINKRMTVVMEEYERTIAVLIAENEQERKRKAEEKMKLISERDEQTAHLASMESSFNDLHSKYEKSKQIILSMKANEDKYKKAFKEFDDNVLKMHKNYELLKQHATSKLNNANMELDKMNKAHEAEVVKLNAMLKRRELDITSLEESLSQKIKANEKLTAICDELLNKVA